MLERQNFEFFNRTRLKCNLDSAYTDEHKEAFCLNEIYVGEKSVSSSAVFRLKTGENDYLGKFKSSGIIISTGTGSTGWLHSCKRFSEVDV